MSVDRLPSARNRRAGAVERAALADLARLPLELRGGTLAAAVVELARRLDAGPEDREVTAIARELRLSVEALRRRAAEQTADPMGGLVERIGATALRH